MREYPDDYCPCDNYPNCDWRGEAFCYSCHEHEVITSNTYRVCFECGHVYETETDLENAYNLACRAIEAQDNRVGFGAGPVRRKAKDIHFCQECIHDF